MNITLTKSADKSICLIYKKLLSDVKTGVSESQANRFSTWNIENDFPNIDRTKFRSDLNELKGKNLIELNIVGYYSLTSDGIIYMESRFQNKLDKIINYLQTIKP